MSEFLPPGKDAFTMGETSRLTGIKPHVLRYWEAGIGLVRPARRGSGHRRFSRHDVETLRRARALVEDQGYTLAGVKRFLHRERRQGAAQISLGFAESAAAVETLKGVKREIAAILRDLKARPVSPS